MSKVSVYNQQGKAGDIEMVDSVFTEKANLDLVHQAVVFERSNRRHPLAHTKNRGEVSGSGKKPWKQKGTGNARAGSIRSPIWRHGGVTFGPRKTRDFSKQINRSQFRKAIRIVLSDLFKHNKVAIVEAPALEKISTKEAVKAVNELKAQAKLETRKVALILKSGSPVLYKSLRNTPGIEVMRISDLTPGKLLAAQSALISKEALPEIERAFAS